MSRVLIVDDDQSFVAIWEAALRHDGYEVRHADSVQEGLSALAARAPDAMLLDWKLPDGTGLAVLEWMHARRLRLATALVTGFWTDADFLQALSDAKRLDVRECLRRGIDFDDPSDVVRRLLDAKDARHAAVLRGDPGAADSLALEIFSSLMPKLQAKFRRAPREMVSDAVTDAMVGYLRDPSAFDEGRGVALDGFIYVAARRKLANAMRSERRHQNRNAAFAAMASPVVSSPDESHSNFVITRALDREPDPAVRQALRQWLDGDRRIELWRTVPRFLGLPVEEIRREVKRIKDAFTARCRRLVC